MGPAAAVCIEAVKVTLNLIFNGTITMGVGEVANFLIGCALSVPAAVLYKRHKTKKTAIEGLCLGTLCMTLLGVVLNWLVLIPAYVSLAHFPMDAIIGMGAAIFPAINSVLKLCILCVAPFNLFKGIVTGGLTMLLYKHVSPILHR